MTTGISLSLYKPQLSEHQAELERRSLYIQKTRIDDEYFMEEPPEISGESEGGVMKNYTVTISDGTGVIFSKVQPAQTAQQASSLVRAFYQTPEGVVKSRRLKI